MDLSTLTDEELLEYGKTIDRKISKHDIFQHSFKILLNSAYGALGSPYFDWFDLRLAEAITTGGQYSIKTAMSSIDSVGEKTIGEKILIAGDTDSAYFTLEKLVEKHCKDFDTQKKVDWIDKFCDKVVLRAIDDSYSSLNTYMNCFTNRMDMEREVIAESAIWSGKKHYAMSVLDNEKYRYPEPELKIMGLAIKKSSIPELFKAQLRECVRLILGGAKETQILELKNKAYSEFIKLHPYEYAINITVNNVSKYLTADNKVVSKTPQQSRAAIAHNLYLDKNGEKSIARIKEGDKIKVVNLKTPNPCDQDVFGFIDFFPEELLEHIDYDAIFDKGFTKPLLSVANAIKWTLAERSSMDGLI